MAATDKGDLPACVACVTQGGQGYSFHESTLKLGGVFQWYNRFTVIRVPLSNCSCEWKGSPKAPVSEHVVPSWCIWTGEVMGPSEVQPCWRKCVTKGGRWDFIALTHSGWLSTFAVWLKLWSLSFLFLLPYLPALVHHNLWNRSRKTTEKGTTWSKTKAGRKREAGRKKLTHKDGKLSVKTGWDSRRDSEGSFEFVNTKPSGNSGQNHSGERNDEKQKQWLGKKNAWEVRHTWERNCR